jgi:signal transduction histidine kinase
MFISLAVVYCQYMYVVGIAYTIGVFALKFRSLKEIEIVFMIGLVAFLFGAAYDFGRSIDLRMPFFIGRDFSRISILVFTFCQAMAVFIATMREVEEAKRKERAVIAENAALERIGRLRAEMLDTISHETRTPLAVLASYSSLVVMEVKAGNTDIMADLDKIAFEAKRVANLIDHVKNLPRHKDNAPKRVSINVNELTEQTAKLYRHILERAQITLNTVLPKDLPPIEGNPEELTQVLFNLLQNAKNHTESGGVTITAAAENGFVSISISDTGSGIPPQILPSIFERGVHGGSGSGIGLAICKEIITDHGGTILAENNPTGGAKVTFTLPTGGAENEA